MIEEDLNVLWERRNLNAIDRIRNIRRAKAWQGETPKFLTTHKLKPLTEFDERGATMPEIKEVPFLKGEDIVEETEVLFLEPHEEVSKDDSGLDKDIQQVLVELPSGQRRVWTMNKTSQRMIAGLHGTNSDNWVGKSVLVYSMDVNVRGQSKKVIYVRNTQTGVGYPPKEVYMA